MPAPSTTMPRHGLPRGDGLGGGAREDGIVDRLRSSSSRRRGRPLPRRRQVPLDRFLQGEAAVVGAPDHPVPQRWFHGGSLRRAAPAITISGAARGEDLLGGAWLSPPRGRPPSSARVASGFESSDPSLNRSEAGPCALTPAPASRTKSAVPLLLPGNRIADHHRKRGGETFGRREPARLRDREIRGRHQLVHVRDEPEDGERGALRYVDLAELSSRAPCSGPRPRARERLPAPSAASTASRIEPTPEPPPMTRTAGISSAIPKIGAEAPPVVRSRRTRA